MFNKSVLALGSASLCLFTFASSAHAVAPVLSVSDLVTNSANLGVGATISTVDSRLQRYDDYFTTSHNTVVKSAFTSEVQTAPTPTQAGLALNYRTDTATTTWDKVNYAVDAYDIWLSSDGQNQSGGKWISISGQVQSSIDLGVRFALRTAGDFTATQTPFGAAAPQLASFYFGPSTVQPLSSSYASSDLTNLTFNSSSTYSAVSLKAGIPQSFVAYVYAPTDVSLSSFWLSAWSDRYDFKTTHEKSVDVGPKTLIGATVLPPVPEPESLALAIAGLAVVGLSARKAHRAH